MNAQSCGCPDCFCIGCSKPVEDHADFCGDACRQAHKERQEREQKWREEDDDSDAREAVYLDRRIAEWKDSR